MLTSLYLPTRKSSRPSPPPPNPGLAPAAPPSPPPPPPVPAPGSHSTLSLRQQNQLWPCPSALLRLAGLAPPLPLRNGTFSSMRAYAEGSRVRHADLKAHLGRYALSGLGQLSPAPGSFSFRIRKTGILLSQSCCDTECTNVGS